MTGFHYFNYRARRSLDYGLYVVEKTTYDAPERDVTVHAIPGRNGDLITDNGRFKNLPVSYKVAVLPGEAASMAEIARKVKRWLLAESGYAVLADTYDDQYFRWAAYYSALGLEATLPQYGETEISFDCKPLRYSFNGQRPRTMTTPGLLHNPEFFSSAPYIKIAGAGDVSLHINANTYSYTGIDGYIEIDAELMNVYRGGASQNFKARAAAFPSLDLGDNLISWTGSVTSLEIVPRWCTL